MGFKTIGIQVCVTSFLLALTFFVFVIPIYAAAVTFSKSTQVDFDAGTYSQADFRTANSFTGVQINPGGGVNGTQYKRPIVINNTGYGTTLTDYVVDFTLDTQSLIAAGKMQSDCGDIRFRDSDDSTSITNLEISNCNTNTTTLKVKVPSIPASSTKTIYLYYGSTSTLSSQSSSQANTVISEDMQSAPTGTLKGSPVATYDSTNKYVQLTTNVGGQWGALEYSGNPGTDFDASFKFWAGGGSGADATYFYVYSTSTPTNESSNTGGYVIYYSEFQNAIRIQYQSSTLASTSQSGMGDSAWHTARIVKSGLNFKVYFDGVEKINYTDSSRTISGNIMGFGARTGGLDNYHRIKNLSVTGVAPSPAPTATSGSESEALFSSGTWTSPLGNDTYDLGTITDWGDGTDGSNAFSATLDNISSDETVELQMKTATTLNSLTSASFTSLGTITSGTSFTLTKAELDTLGISPSEYVQVKGILNQINNTSPVLKSFTLNYLDATVNPSDSSSTSLTTSVSTTTECSDSTPTKVPDLFHIDIDNSSATLHFTTGEGASGYQIMYGFDEKADQFGDNFDYSGPLWVLDRQIQDLSPNTTYYFKVRAAHGCTAGPFSRVVSATTQDNKVSLATSFPPKTIQQTIESTVDQTAHSASQVPVLENVVDKKIEVGKSEIKEKPPVISYQVQEGDNLWSIAQKFLGNGAKFPEIVDFNKIKFPDFDVNKLASGMKVDIDLSHLSPEKRKEVAPQTLPQNGYDLDIKILADSGAPLAGAKVTLHSNPKEAVTNQQGIAHFSGVEGGKHQILIAYNGYSGGGQAVNVTGDNKNIELVMQVKLTEGFDPSKVLGIIGVLVAIIIALFVILFKNRRRIFFKP